MNMFVMKMWTWHNLCICKIMTEVTKKLEKINFNEILHSVTRLLLWVKMTWTFPSLCCQS